MIQAGDGTISGTAALPDGEVFATLSGSVSGNVMTQVQTYNSFDSGYTATLIGTVSDDGKTLTGSWTSNGGQQGTFTANLVSGDSTTTTTTAAPTTTTTSSMTTALTTTTPTTPTTPTPARHPSAAQVMCNFVVAVAQDTCTATVGDATGQGTLPTGTVTFTSANRGEFPQGATCHLSTHQGDVGLTSCDVQYIAPASASLMVTAEYSGDSTFAPSSGSTQFLLAGIGNGAYLQHIGQFDPPTLSATVDNPTSGSTVSVSAAATADLTDGGICLAESGDSSTAAPASAIVPADGRVALRAPGRTTRAPSMVRVSVVRRRVAKGRLRIPLHLSLARLRRAFPRGGRVQIVVAVRIKPSRGPAATIFQRKVITLRWRDKQSVTASQTAETPFSRAHQASVTHEWSNNGPCGTVKLSTTYVPPASGHPPAQVPVTVTWINITALCFTGVGASGGGGGVSVSIPPLRDGVTGTLGSSGFSYSSTGTAGPYGWGLSGVMSSGSATMFGNATANGVDPETGAPYSCQAVAPRSLQQVS